LVESTPLLIPLSVLLAYAVVAHGLILLNNGLNYDGWVVDSWQRKKDWKSMKRFFSEVGMPILYYQHKFIAMFPNRVFAYRLVAFSSTYASAVFIYLTSTQFHFLSSDHALVLALLYLAYTGYHMNVDTIVGVQYTFPTAVFYLAVFSAFLAHSQNGYTAWLLHVSAILLFMLSFNANSLLVFYFGFLGLSAWHQSGREIAGLVDANLIAKNIPYGVLPFIYWAIKKGLTPQHGYYANYNRIQFSLRPLFEGYLRLMCYGIEAAITLPIRFVFANRLAWIPIFLGLSIYLLIAGFWSESSLTLPMEDSLALLCFGFVLVILVGLPYTLVGQPFRDQGWATKNSMLLHLPVAMISWGLLTMLIPDPRAVLGVLIFYVLACCAYIVRNYLYYLAAYVKDRSWLFKLKNVPGIEEYSLFQVIDQHWLKAELRYRYQDYAPAYLFFMFDWLWGGTPSRFGMREFAAREPYTANEVSAAIEDTTFAYSMTEVNRNGKQARVIIKSGELKSFFRIALSYIGANYFDGQANRMEALLAAVTDIEVSPLG